MKKEMLIRFRQQMTDFVIVFLVLVSVFSILGSMTEDTAVTGRFITPTEKEAMALYNSNPKLVQKALGVCLSDDECPYGVCRINKIRQQLNVCVQCNSDKDCMSEKPLCKKSGLPPNNVCVRCYGSSIGCDRKIEYCQETRGDGGSIVSACLKKKAESELCRLSYECATGKCDRNSKKCVSKQVTR